MFLEIVQAIPIFQKNYIKPEWVIDSRHNAPKSTPRIDLVRYVRDLVIIRHVSGWNALPMNNTGMKSVRLLLTLNFKGVESVRVTWSVDHQIIVYNYTNFVFRSN